MAYTAAAREAAPNGEVTTDDAFGTMLDDVTASVGQEGVGGAEEVVMAVVVGLADPERDADDDEKEEEAEEEGEEELTDGDEMMGDVVEDAVEAVVAAVVAVAVVAG